MATPKVVWKDPGVARTGSGNNSKYAELQQALRAHPGKWALLAKKDKHITATPSFRGKDFERAYRTRREGGRKVFEIYVRYIGK